MFRFASKRLTLVLLALSVVITVLAVGTGVYLSSRETVTVSVSGYTSVRTTHGNYCIEGSALGISINDKPSKARAQATNCSDKPANLVITRKGYFTGGNSYKVVIKEGLVEPGESLEVTVDQAHAEFFYELREGDTRVGSSLGLSV